jgi:hypothetical protein
MNVLMLLIGRYTNLLRGDDKKSLHFGLVALAKVAFPLTEVLKQSFWMIMWTSALFFSLVCWDIAGDVEGHVRWVESIWIPITTICYPILLWAISFYFENRGQQIYGTDDETKESTSRDAELELAPLPPLVDVTSCSINNPIHSEL